MIDELITLIDDVEPPEGHPGTAPLPWKLLVVDDDPEVHSTTRFVLHDLHVLGRPLQLLHAHDGLQAREQLRKHQDVAVALVDVVMETERAGLDLVGFIRDQMDLSECRIILRTGQPGYAPEVTVIHEYDINDYRTKAELTHTRLITMVSAALRSYDQLHSLAEHRRGLELIVGAAADLMEQRAVTSLAEGILTQLAALLKLSVDGVVCTQRGGLFGGEGERCFVVAAAGRHARHIAQPLETLPDERIVSAIMSSVTRGQHVFGPDYTVLYLKAAPHQDAAIFLDSGQALNTLDRPLLEIFVANIAACFRNVRLVERLHHLAYHDPLTGLANRQQFIIELDGARCAPSDAVVALVDIDHFADLNDGLGPDTGDLLLGAVATRLQATLEPGCRVAHIGADVFGVLGPEHAVNVSALRALFLVPFAVREYELPVTVTVGLCRQLSDADSGVALLKRVNIALNRAKRSHSTYHEYYLAEMEDNTRWRLEVIRSLRRDFELRKLQVWYQPQISLASGTVSGVEALVRWPDDDGGFVHGPDVFIPLAEYSGLIVQIGAWVLDQACAQHVELAAAGFAQLRMAVNVSMPQFRKADFVGEVAHIVASHRVPPSLLELEITESIAMDEPKVVLESMQALKRLGIQIAIDDFGTSYSSLGQLQALPFDCLKIDRSFVSRIDDGQGGLFAETIVGLGKRLGVALVAEGVETDEQAAFLHALGCTTAQGYWYARPMPAEELMTWLRQRA